MEILLGGREVRLVIHDPAATVADLARVAGLPVASLGVPPSTPVAELPLARGGDLGGATTAAAADRPPDAAVAAVAVVGGLDAGRRASLPAGRAVLGRADGTGFAPLDPTVSRRHAELDVGPTGAVTVADLGSRNGTWLLVGGDAEIPVGAGRSAPLPPGATLRLGASEVAVVATDPTAAGDAPVGGPADRRSTAAGTTAFNRPPRPAPGRPPAPVAVPDPPPAPNPPVALGVVTVLAPLVMAGVLVVAMGNPVFALLALLSPVVAIGNHVEGKRRTTRTRRRDVARRRADLAVVADALALAADAEVARRREEVPDPAEVLRRAEQPSTRLWERRPQHDDSLRLRVGVGDVPWDPPLDGDRHPRPADLGEVVAAAAVLRRCPATIDLAGGGVVGIVGPRAAALAVARSLLCQAGVHHGPADLPVLVAVTADATSDWDWVKWIPHVEDVAGTGRRLAAGREVADALAAALLADDGGPAPLVVVDGDELLEGRRSPARSLLAGRAAGIVVSGAVDRLPAACTAVLVVDDDGGAELRLPALGRRVPGLRAAGMADDTARRCARALARFDDPELDVAGAGLPDTVRLLPLLGLDDPSPATVADRWSRPRTSTPIALAADGVVDLDLVADGPHALIAGTTGAGKSELLRTLVVGLAAGADPDHLTFVLIDFKGGSAFDACARLPHVVGLVTDLDDDLAERALRCLEAELRHRERVLRAGGDARPRLVVVVDEFATLKAELPDFVESLVGVAQRGRSLGVHLVLATQRPAGAVSDNIRANANLRIALRVQDVADSIDVVDVADAAHLPRSRPGRACVRLGPGEVVAVQTALATSTAGRRSPPPVELVPFTFGPTPEPSPASAAIHGGATDLDRLVDACVGAWAGRPAPRRPWPEPLPAVLDLGELAAGDVAVADDPDGQRRVPLRWEPADGNLAVYGVGGSGTTSTLLAVALALADERGPDRLHLYAVDHGAGDLAVLGGLPHTGAVIAAGERQRQSRLVGQLRADLARRRSLPAEARAAEPAVVVLVDGVGGFLAQFGDVGGFEVVDAFERVFADGPEAGIHIAVAADRPGALPTALASLVRQRWVHRLADPLDAGAAGVPGRPRSLVPGRFFDTVSGLVAQVARPAEGWEAAVSSCAARWVAAGVEGDAAPVGELPAVVAWSTLAAATAAPMTARPWPLAVGVADDDLEVVTLPLWEGEHVLVAGPGRSGRTTTLATVGSSGVAAGARVLAVAGRRSWLAATVGVEAVELGDLASLDGDSPTLVLVDDADLLDDPAGLLGRLLASAPPAVHVVAAGRADVLRGLYDHWTRTVRRSRLGVLLRPHLDLDGELLATALPRRVGVPLVAGRGFLVVDGVARLVQVGLPE